MEPTPEKQSLPLLVAITFFAVSALSLVLFALLYDFSETNIPLLFFLLCVVSISLLTKIIYTAFKDHEIDKNFSEEISSSTTFEANELYTELYKNSPIPYLLINFNGEIISANIAALRFLGLSKTKVEGLPIFKRIFSNQSEHVDFIKEKYQNKLSVSNETVQIRQSETNNAWALLSLFQFNGKNGEHLGLLTLVDITKQKRIESAKTEFVSLASHQLRTPIAAIKWSAELLQIDEEKNLTDRQKKYIDRLLLGSKRMAILVDDFLRVSKFELGTFQPEYTKISLTETIEAVIVEQASKAAAKKIVTNTFFDSAIDTMCTDQNLVRMIVTNLYSNAVKYSKDSGTIHIGFGKKGENVLISVADNGLGIPMVDQDRIFSKLFRAKNAVREVPDGTGLGLYIAKQAVEVLRGKISFTSTEDRSTTFEVVLPTQSAPSE